MRHYLELALIILAATASWCAWAYLNPFTDCRWCHGTGRHSLSGRRYRGSCWNPRCQRGQVQRLGSKTVHRAVRALITYHRKSKEK